ncbi:hypothetical protein RND71_014296 [Anisodus tanguticus]|uniref:WRKY domain-containing protein n=1 Tax=Anisodus tanguticus TaxID=243964 RepID=A0AAE1VJT1_9SOLA|nr:hypothetical protein RND71_014296 [Anisodus tanguticus]
MEGNGEPVDEWNCELVVGNLDSKTMHVDATQEIEENGVNGSFSSNNKRSIAERRAAKCGFNASSISTPAMSPPPARETFLTIPPGLTPAALLDSPVMLPNSQAPQSPTTGSFYQFPTIINQENSMTPHSDHHVVINANFPIKNNVIDQSQSTTRDHFEFPEESPKVTALKNCSSDTPSETNTQQNMSCIDLTNTTQLRHCSLRGAPNPNIITSNGSDDGYTWRKYGQKTVKGSEFPRSYYKCTQQNCLVKKKVERSPDGQITEIIYKGEHNHHKSQPPRRATSSNPYGLVEMSNEGNGGSSIWRNMQFGGNNKDVRALSVLEKTSSASVLTEVSDSLMSKHHKTNMNVFESAETTPEPSSTLASRDDEDEDRATEGSTSLGDEADDNEFEHKRRRRDFYSAETSLLSRTTREPRVVVQIESEIDILDDGYRWRKYGQKVVKGNPNPRSYYKCTNAGCPVRKHVERAPDNLKSVITTYEGRHNHEVPSANKTNGTAATGGNQASASTSNGQSSILASPENHKVSNLGMQVQDLNFQFERKPCDYVRPSFLGSHLSDLRCGGASPLYDLRFPPNLHSSLSYNSFLLSPTQISCSRSFTPLHIPDFPLPMSFPVGPNVVPPLGGFHFNDLPLTPNGVSSHSSLAVGDQKQIYENNNNNNDKNSRFLKVNEEIKNENLYDHQNGVLSTVFHGHIMDNFSS